METAPSRPDEFFALNVVAGSLAGFRPPADSFDPRGNWRLTYGVYTLAGRGGRVGSMRIERKAHAEHRSVIELNYQKVLSGGFRQTVTATMHCRCDALSAPLSWTYRSETTNRAGEPLAQVAIDKSGAADGDKIEIDGGGRRRQLSIQGPYTINWALFEAVGRFPRKRMEPLKFSMLDHFDQVKRDQSLAYRTAVDVSLGKETIRLHAFDQLGHGIVPWVYWVDEPGRTLFAVSGIEGYLLNL